MKRNKKAGGSFFTLLLRNYILFTLLIIVALSGVFAVTLLRINGKIVESYPNQLLEYSDILAQEQYEKIPTERLFGKNSYLVVLDEHHEKIYTNSPGAADADIQFTSRELFYIPDFTKNSEITVTEFYNARGEKQISVVTTVLDEDKDRYHKEYVLDETYHILYSSDNNPNQELTAKEFELLKGKYKNDLNISKHSFTTNQNKRYTLLILQPVNFSYLIFGKIQHVLSDSLLLFTILYIFLIAIFVMWLHRTVKKPLSMLNHAIVDFSSGKREQYLSYKGPRDFSNIFDSFNDMSQRLLISETERKKLEQGRQKMLADISHDFKTPISVIQGYAKALSDGLVPSEKQTQYLETISRKADLLNDLINTFHEYSKLEHPDYVMTFESCDICVFLRDYMAEKYSELELLGFEVDIDIPELHFIGKIDKLQLKRAFENIISNSIKHNKSGTTLYFHLIPIESHIKITIADNGCGIPPDIAQTIFEPFVVGEKSRSNKGSGLGLAISKKIIEAHGGKISLIQPPKAEFQTQFEIILPIQEKA